ncbi:hypothetical protein D3C78_1230160 [compost metagenome]
MNRSFLLVVGDFTDAEQRFAKLTLKPFCFGLGGGIDINELFIADYLSVVALLQQLVGRITGLIIAIEILVAGEGNIRVVDKQGFQLKVHDPHQLEHLAIVGNIQP